VSQTVKVEALVRTDPQNAFRVFTDEVNAWWRKAAGPMRFADGKLWEGDFEIGRVLTWEPGARLVFEWRTRDFAPGEKTEVDIRFEAEGDATRVTLLHRGWESLPEDHPIRAGFKTGPAFRDMIGLRWAEQLTAYRGRF